MSAHKRGGTLLDKLPDRVHGCELVNGKYMIVDDNTLTLDDDGFLHFYNHDRPIAVNIDHVVMIKAFR